MELLQQIFNGLTIGSTYALVAIGFSVVYGALGLVNFAHGDILMAGAFTTYGLYALGVPLPLACLGGIVVGSLLAVAVEEVAVRPVLTQHLLIPMMTTLGAGLIIRNVVERIWGNGTLPFPSFTGGGYVHIGDLQISKSAVVTLIVAFIAMIAFLAFLKFTKAGFAIRAVAQDMTAARLMGVPVNRTIAVVYLTGGAMGVVGGLLYANTLEVVYLGMGFAVLLKGFAAAIVGGIGNLQGAMIGGLIIGVLESTVGPAAGSYRDAVAFVLLIAILLVRPTGLLGARIQERV